MLRLFHEMNAMPPSSGTTDLLGRAQSLTASLLVTFLAASPVFASIGDMFACLHVGMSMKQAALLMGNPDARRCSTTLGVEKCVYWWKSQGITRSEHFSATFVLDHLVSKQRCSDRCPDASAS